MLSAIHTIGHVINFRFLSLQSAQVLTCLLPNLVSNDGSERHPTFFQFLFTTHQGIELLDSKMKQNLGITGLMLITILSLMHTFASKRSRRRRHRLFWRSHMLYPLFFVVLLLHGIEGLLQEPRFHLYLIIPGIFQLCQGAPYHMGHTPPPI